MVLCIAPWLHIYTANAKFLLDGDNVLQLGGDPEELAVVSDNAAVHQGDSLLICFPNIKVLKRNKVINCQPAITHKLSWILSAEFYLKVDDRWFADKERPFRFFAINLHRQLLS